MVPVVNRTDPDGQRHGPAGLPPIPAAPACRAQVAQATWDMAQDRLWTGWGPGAFQYHFPKYQKAYPEIYGSTWESRKFWAYAHSDPVQC